MQISNLRNMNGTNFGNLNIHPSFYDKAVVLIQNRQTSDIYQREYKALENASQKRQLEIRGLGDNGGVVVELDTDGKIIRYISKSFQNVIDSMKNATLKLTKENNPDNKQRKKPFEGNI